LVEGNATASVTSGLRGISDRKLSYIRYLRRILALGYGALILGVLIFFMFEQDPDVILLSMYGAAASIFAMAIVGMIWVTGEQTAVSSGREWQYQFFMIAGLLLIGTALVFLGTVVLALPYAIVMYLYLARLIRGPSPGE